MTGGRTILIAVDGDDAEVCAGRATQAATSLFPDATFRFVHVARPVAMTPAGAYGPAGMAPMAVGPIDLEGERADILRSAHEVAEQAARESGVPNATSVGLIGEPAETVIAEAAACGAAAIVISAHDRGWVERLFHHSVRRDIERMSTVPVVVAPAAC